MRTLLTSVVLFFPVVALGATSARGSFGAGHGSRAGGAGLGISYQRQTSHSSFSFQFSNSSTYGVSSGRSAFYGGAPWGGYRSSGVYVSRGWVPYAPYVIQPYPRGFFRGVGPFTYTDSVVFYNTPGVPVFGYGQRVAEAVAAAERGEGGAAAQAAPGPNPAASALIGRGDDQFIRGDFQQAAEAYRAAARSAPNDPMAAFALGHGLFATGEYREAATALRRGLRLYPALTRVRLSRRDFYGKPEAFDEQLARLAQHVAACPKDGDARFLLGYNYYFTQRYGEAEEQFAALGGQDAEAQLFLLEIRRLK